MTVTPTAGAAGTAGTAGAARIAYFTMEVALEAAIPTYSGGLGVLAGDYLMSAADLGLPVVAVSLVYRDGYFRQLIDASGGQREEPTEWDRAAVLERLDATVTIEVGGHSVVVGAWQYVIGGVGGARVPVIFLDTDLPDNLRRDRDITDRLYGGDNEHRLRQEAVLGLGGVAMLRALGYSALESFHMNEGHSSLLTLRLLEESLAGSDEVAFLEEVAGAVEAVRRMCAFTTHTPVPAGHDRFPAKLVSTVLGDKRASALSSLGVIEDGMLNMTSLGIALSGYVNAVSLRHGEVTRDMLPGTPVRSITNGVHHVRWAAAPVASMFDAHLPGWRSDASILRYAAAIPLDEIGAAHEASKRELCASVASLVGVKLSEDALTIGLARRVTPYKRTLLLFSDPEKLVSIADGQGPLQIVCSGKAHPRDEAGRATIARLVELGKEFEDSVRVVFLPGYDLSLAALLCAGCDLWLNTPQPPLEASGTSGMKAALNGVPSLSILDGWWLEGCVEGVTGWAIGADEGLVTTDDAATLHAEALYSKLESVVAPAYYGDPAGWRALGRQAIALNGSFFNTERMAREYARAAYGLGAL